MSRGRDRGKRDGRIELCEEGCLGLWIRFVGRGEVVGQLWGRGVGAAGGGHAGAAGVGGSLYFSERIGWDT